MRTRDQISAATPTEPTATRAAPRRLHSLILSWHDEESGDDLTVDILGSERFLKDLMPLGFVPLAERSTEARAAQPSPRRRRSESAEHRVHWTVRLARHWNPKSR